jgi:2'-5' RNA ligase
MTGLSGRKSHRLFFAIVPDTPARVALLQATRATVRATGGRPTAAGNLHLTVAFLGNVETSRIDAVRDAAPPDAACFDLHLGRYANRRGMLWLEPLALPEALVGLEQALWERLEQRGFVREPRAYRPHFTLARDARHRAEGGIDVVWQVRALHLMESIGGDCGPTYVSIRAWALE